LQWINCLIQIKYRKLNQQKIISQKSSGSKKLQKNKRKKTTRRRSVLFVLKQKKIEMKVSHQIFVGSQKVIILDREKRKVQRKLKAIFFALTIQSY
jgi:hypothetical protein